MYKSLSSLLLLSFLCTCGRAQSFSAFSGDLLEIEEKAFRCGFDHYPDMMKVVGQISFPTLDFFLSSTLMIDTAGSRDLPGPATMVPGYGFLIP